MAYVFRNACMEDVERLWHMMDALDHETKYMMYEPGERPPELSRLTASVQGSVDGGDFMLLCEQDGQIIGYIFAQRGGLKRVRHTAYIVTGIRDGHRNRGIGSEFFDRLIMWAKENGVTRLELTVICTNTAAKHLYERKGFIVEGTRTRSMLVDGEYVDEYYMAKLF